MNKVSAARINACAALELSYWSGHPNAGSVWAVDDFQSAHEVKIDMKRGQAWVVNRDGFGQARRGGPVVDFDASAPWELALAEPEAAAAA